MAAKKTTSIGSQLAYRMYNTGGLGAGMAGVGAGAIGKLPSVPKSPTISTQKAGAAFAGTGSIGALKPAANATPFGIQPGAAATPAAGAAPGAPGAPVDPLAKYKDSTYFAAVAQNLATRGTGLAQLDENDKRLKEDNSTAMERLARSYADQRQNLNEGANKQGLFYSGILGKRLGDAEQVNKDQTNDAGKQLERALLDDQSQRDTLKRQYGDPDKADDYGLSGASLLAEAGQRYATNNPLPPDATGAATPPPAGTLRTVAGVNITPQNWATGSYTNDAGHEVRRFADGHREVMDPKTKTWKRV